MKLHMPGAEIYVPDGTPVGEALARTTHLGIAAHQDDLEIMAAQAILECFQQPDRWFTGVVLTDGRGSPRTGLYEQYSDEQMREVRRQEQRKAAFVGEYSAAISLDYPSSAVKDPGNTAPAADLLAILEAARPRFVYTHNLADKHITHVAAAVKAVQAVREMQPGARPERLYGCEVWRGLDWMADGEKTAFDVSDHPGLQAALLGVFDSQISGGKRYDLATSGRRVANATYAASHEVDKAAGLVYAMDLTPLAADPSLDIRGYVLGFIDRFRQDVSNSIALVSTTEVGKEGPHSRER